MSERPQGEYGQQVYLRSSLIAIRYERERYVLFHLGSGSFIATDWLGVRAARLLLGGDSGSDVARRVEREAAGAGERLQALMRRLVSIGATSSASPQRTLRWRARVAGSLALGWLLSLSSALLRWSPLWVLHRLYEVLPQTPVGKRIVGQSFAWMDGNLCASGFAGELPERRAEIARASGAAVTRLFYCIFLCGLLPPERWERLLTRIVDVASFEVMRRQVAQSGAVLASVHSDLFFALPIYLRAQGVPVSCVADMFGLGVALASDLDIRLTFPALFPEMIDSRGAMSGRDLLRRLGGGEVVAVAFDAPPQREAAGEDMSTISFLGRSVRRFDGAAWLAVRSGKPLIVVGTHRRGKRTLAQVTLLRPDSTRPPKEQVVALTTHMYALGEAFIREYPESWMAWSYFHEFGALETSETRAQGAVTGLHAGCITPDAIMYDME